MTGPSAPARFAVGTRTIVLLTLAFVLAVIALCVWWFGRDSSTHAAGARATTAPATAGKPMTTPIVHTVATTPAGQVSMLYTLSATSGTLTPIAGTGRYTLTLHDTDTKVIWFSDAPARKAGVLPTGGFATEWRGFGFVTDPPNAAITLHNGDPQADTVIAEMSRRPVFDATTNTFRAQVRLLPSAERAKVGGNLARHVARADSTVPASFDDVSLFIDDTSGTVVNDCLIQPYAVCEGADLSGAQLSGADLAGADLALADLSGADLSNANLQGANLTGADLTDANLSGANLRNANLSGANLSGTDLTGADTRGATMPTSRSGTGGFCGIAGQNVSIAPGLFADSFSAPTGITPGVTPPPGSRHTGTVTVVGPGGTLLSGSYTCTTPFFVGGPTWSITITGTTGMLSTSVPGLSLQPGSTFTGTISSATPTPTWRLSANVQLGYGGATVYGSLAASGVHDWSVTLNGYGGAITDSDQSSYALTSASGTITVAGSSMSGAVTLGAGGQQPLLASLPASWTKTASFAVTFARPAIGAPVTLSSTLSIAASSGANSVSLSGAWLPTGYTLSGSGTVVIGAASVSLTGSYDSTGYVSNGAALTAPWWQLKGSIGSVPLGNGATMTSGSVSASSDVPGFTGTVQVQPTTSSSFSFEATLGYTDAADWTLTADGQSVSSSWTPPGLPGVTLDPSQVSGTITSSSSAITWNLSVGKIAWNMPGTGITLVGSFSLGNTCPLTPATLCGSASGLFLGAASAKMSYPDQTGRFAVQGAVLLDGSWGMAQGNLPTVTVRGPVGNAMSVSNGQVWVWAGSAQMPNPITGLTMPDLTASNNGVGTEICGVFDASLPYINASAASGGCISRAAGGYLIGQVGIGGGNSGGTTGGVTIGNVTIDGWAWTNLSGQQSVGLDGVTVAATKGKSQLTGSMAVPGTVLSALGHPVSATIPATGSFSNDSFVAADTSFTFDAGIAVNSTGNGFALNSVDLNVGRTSKGKWTFALDVDASYTVDGSSFPATLSFAAGTGSGLVATLTATGTRTTAAPCSCDGVNTPLPTPQTGWAYLSDHFGAVPGAHLWSAAGQLEFQNGSPGFGVGATVYYDPSSAPNLFHGSTWLKGDFYTNVSDTSPCFDFSFTSGDPNTYVQIQGGVFRTSTFQIAIAPTGCTVGALSLPAGSTFMFTTAFGSDASLAIDLSIGLDANGQPTFTFDTSIANIALGGIDFVSGELDISITATSSSTTFGADLSMPFGTLNGAYALTANTDGSIQLSGSVSLANWKASGNFTVNSFTFSMSMSTAGCASFDDSASGQFTSAQKAYSFNGEIAVNCNGLQTLDISFTYTHGGSNAVSQTITISYSASAGIFSGGYTWSYQHTSSHRYIGHTYDRGMTITISIAFWIDFNNVSNSGVTLSGTVDGGSVSGSVSATLTASGDDYAHASLSIRVSSLNKWSDSWTW